MTELKVLPCGTSITSINGDVMGNISCISIRYGKISYELTYFFNGEFKTTWMHESEFNHGAVKQKIGFNK